MAGIVFKAPQTIARFMRSDAFMRAVVGPVGSGKSSACVMEILVRATKQAPNEEKVRSTRFAIIRNTYSQLRDTTRKTFLEWIPPQIGKFHEQSFTFNMNFPLPDGTQVVSEVLFRALDGADDVRKLLSLELTGAYVNEAREIPWHVIEILQQRVGRYPAVTRGGPSWSGIWMDTNPWHTKHWGYQAFSVKKLKGYEIFEQPGARSGFAENLDHLPPDYYDRIIAGSDDETVASYVDAKYPTHDRGSVWGDLIAILEAKDGGIADFEHPKDGVFTSWDLGFTDATAIWFWRVNEHGVSDIIDHYEAHGKPLSHYFDVVGAKGYEYAKHWLPHDAKQKTLQSGVSIFEQFADKYGYGLIGQSPSLSLLDGIQAGRWLLEQPMRFHDRCRNALEALREYRYEYDEDTKSYSRRPVHNWASHSADAFRYLALVVKVSGFISRPEVTEKKDLRILSPDGSWTFDQLLKDRIATLSKDRGRI